jgi:hypothetical protein
VAVFYIGVFKNLHEYIQLYHTTGAAKDKRRATNEAKSNDNTNIYSTLELTLLAKLNIYTFILQNGSINKKKPNKGYKGYWINLCYNYMPL